MAFENKDLGVLAYCNGFTLWRYKTADDSTHALIDGYFNRAANMLRVGDMIIMQFDNKSTVVFVTGNDGLSISSANPGT